MDIATFFGVVSGFSLVILAIKMGGGLLWFWNAPSAMIVMGGTIAVTLINYPLSDVLSVVRVLKNAFLYQLPVASSVVPEIVELSKIARREGILALEKKVKQMKDPFINKGVELAVDGMAYGEFWRMNLFLPRIGIKKVPKFLPLWGPMHPPWG